VERIKKSVSIDRESTFFTGDRCRCPVVTYSTLRRKHLAFPAACCSTKNTVKPYVHYKNLQKIK
jgi:hypothetical protein